MGDAHMANVHARGAHMEPKTGSVAVAVRRAGWRGRSDLAARLLTGARHYFRLVTSVHLARDLLDTPVEHHDTLAPHALVPELDGPAGFTREP